MNDFTYIFATKIVEVFPISIVSNVFLNIKIICAQNSRYAPVFSILLDTFFHTLVRWTCGLLELDPGRHPTINFVIIRNLRGKSN